MSELKIKICLEKFQNKQEENYKIFLIHLYLYVYRIMVSHLGSLKTRGRIVHQYVRTKRGSCESPRLKWGGRVRSTSGPLYHKRVNMFIGLHLSQLIGCQCVRAWLTTLDEHLWSAGFRLTLINFFFSFSFSCKLYQINL